VTGPNGAAATTTYDSAGRPSQTTTADGAVTDYTYTYTYVPNSAANTQTAILCDPNNGQCTSQAGHRWTRTTLDGFGRTTRVEQGHDSVTVSQVDTQYAPSACSPLGKISQVSKPYAPGATPVWTVYTYDASGRTLTVTAPDAVSTTNYSYQANQTTVTDPAGKWKIFTNDAMGNLISATEPDPAGGANLVTNYTYNQANQLTGVSMPRSTGTQSRTFAWTGSDLTSATNPENGTVTYTYDGAHHPLTRTDAKGQQTQYSYDPYGRLTEVRHYVPVPPYNQLQEQTNQRVDYYYDTDYTGLSPYGWGRLGAVTFDNEGAVPPSGGPQFTYYYSYNQAGRVTRQRLQIAAGSNPSPANLDATYAWDTEGRMTSQGYPGFGNLGVPDNPPVYTYQYDSATGRLNGMMEPSCNYFYGSLCSQYATTATNQVASATYSPAGQVSNLTYDGYSETRSYNSLLQLTRMTVAGTMDMQYTYSATQNNGRITQTTDYISGETVTYAYDTLNRLQTAAGSGWSSTYTYDGFGNMTGQASTGGAPGWPGSVSYNAATNWPSTAVNDANGNPGFPANGATVYPYDVENRLLQATDTNGSTWWAYDHRGKRVWYVWPTAGGPNSTQTTCEIYFYGITGQKLATYSCNFDDAGSNPNRTNAFSYWVKSRNLYFAGKLMRSAGATVVTDRLGSVRANSNGEKFTYWPYGQERTSTTDGREKFGTYFKDPGPNGMYYADQRYYQANSRFLTPDPAGLSAATPGNPTSRGHQKAPDLLVSDAEQVPNLDFEHGAGRTWWRGLQQETLSGKDLLGHPCRLNSQVPASGRQCTIPHQSYEPGRSRHAADYWSRSHRIRLSAKTTHSPS